MAHTNTDKKIMVEAFHQVKYAQSSDKMQVIAAKKSPNLSSHSSQVSVIAYDATHSTASSDNKQRSLEEGYLQASKDSSDIYDQIEDDTYDEMSPDYEFNKLDSVITTSTPADVSCENSNYQSKRPFEFEVNVTQLLDCCTTTGSFIRYLNKCTKRALQTTQW